MAEENLTMVRRWWEGFNREGVPSLDLCDEQVEIRIPPEFPFTGVYIGHAGVRKWAAEVFDTISNHRVEIERLVAAPDGETVVMELRSRGRWKHMDIDLELPWAALWVIRDGRLVYAQGYLAPAEALEAAGIST